LTTAERRTKARCDAIIRAGKKSFLRTCRALARYNRLRLYREDYPSFEQYVKAELGITRGRAYQMIAAGLLSTQVDIQNEKQARELIQLPEQVRPLAWELAKDWAKEAAPGKDIPVRFLKAAVSVVVTAIETGGYVDTGNGEMTGIDAALTQDVHESMMRQRQHIKDSEDGKRKSVRLIDYAPFRVLNVDIPRRSAYIQFEDEKTARAFADYFRHSEPGLHLTVLQREPDPFDRQLSLVDLAQGRSQ
jgi:hypothetical protein